MTVLYRKRSDIQQNLQAGIRLKKERIDIKQFPFFKRLSLETFVVGLDTQTIDDAGLFLDKFCKDSMILLLFKDFKHENIKMLCLCFQEDLINKVHAVDKSNVESSLTNHKRLNNFIDSEMKRLNLKLMEGGRLEYNLEIWANRIIFFIQHSVVLNNHDHFLV